MLFQFRCCFSEAAQCAALQAEAEQLAAAGQQLRAEEQASRTVLQLEQQKLELVLDQLATLRCLSSHRRHQVDLRASAHRVLAEAETTQRKVASLDDDFQQLHEEKVCCLVGLFFPSHVYRLILQFAYTQR